jgi:hypothetical protein
MHRSMKQHKYSVEVIEPEIELDERLDLHEKGWAFQKIGIVFLFLLVVSAAIGLFGQGVLSRQSYAASGAEITFERFFRQEARMSLEISIHSAPGNKTIVSFPNQYLKDFRIESILPEPRENRLEGNRIDYVFEGSAPMELVFYVIPQKIGSQEGEVRINDVSFQVAHFIYP